MPLTDGGRHFHEEYRRKFRQMRAAAQYAAELVGDALRDEGFSIHQIEARAKGSDSLLRKLREKSYVNPASEVTDLVGVRVISYFADEVDKIAAVLSDRFDLDERSVDKQTKLSVREFGYRSVHLIVRARLTGVEGPVAESLRDLWFEIQVRSLLEHAWAEVEHDLVYKSGIVFPDNVTRDLAGMAAQLETIDQSFLNLRSARYALVEEHRQAYASNLDDGVPLDAARLAGLLESVRPEGRSFAQMSSGMSLPSNAEAVCVDALRAAGTSTGSELRTALVLEANQTLFENYASLEGISEPEVSHFAICVLVASRAEPLSFAKEFPELVEDERLRQSMLPTEDSEDN